MIIGLLLGISLAVSLTSLIIILTGISGILRENVVTGAVIGTSGVISYAIIALVLSLVVVFFLALILKNPKKNLEEY
jgi:fucose permease